MEIERVVKDLEHLFAPIRRPPLAELSSARERDVLDLVMRLRGSDAADVAGDDREDPRSGTASMPDKGEAGPVGTDTERRGDGAGPETPPYGEPSGARDIQEHGVWLQPGAGAEAVSDERAPANDA
jgi:hypothetical protein